MLDLTKIKFWREFKDKKITSKYNKYWPITTNTITMNTRRQHCATIIIYLNIREIKYLKHHQK